MSDREVCPDHGQPKGMRYKGFCCDCLRAENSRLSAEVAANKGVLDAPSTQALSLLPESEG